MLWASELDKLMKRRKPNESFPLDSVRKSQGIEYDCLPASMDFWIQSVDQMLNFDKLLEWEADVERSLGILTRPPSWYMRSGKDLSIGLRVE